MAQEIRVKTRPLPIGPPLWEVHRAKSEEEPWMGPAVQMEVCTVRPPLKGAQPPTREGKVL